MKKKCPYQILIAIINEQKALETRLIKIINEYASKSIVSQASGTAPSSASDFFGFGITEKSILSAIIPSEKADEIMKFVSSSMNTNKNNKGIVMTLPLSAMDSRIFEELEAKNG